LEDALVLAASQVSGWAVISGPPDRFYRFGELALHLVSRCAFLIMVGSGPVWDVFIDGIGHLRMGGGPGEPTKRRNSQLLSGKNVASSRTARGGATLGPDLRK